MSPSISALGTSAATESTTITSIAPLRTSASVISSACSPVSGLRNVQVVHAHAQDFGIHGVERVLGVDEGRRAAQLLRLRNDMQRDGRLTGGLGSIDLHDPAARDAAHAERIVQLDAAGGDDRNRDLGARVSSFMTAPLPNCFSIWLSAISSAFSFSTPMRSNRPFRRYCPFAVHDISISRTFVRFKAPSCACQASSDRRNRSSACNVAAVRMRARSPDRHSFRTSVRPGPASAT